MIKIGINGFGRIGKCCFLQLINDTDIEIKCINSVNLSINDIEDYLSYDSTHTNYTKNFNFKIINAPTKRQKLDAIDAIQSTKNLLVNSK